MYANKKQQQIQSQQQNQPSSIPTTQKPSNNFQQTLPRYNPPPNPLSQTAQNPAIRRLAQPVRGRYSTGSLIPPAVSSASHQPSLISPALSTTSSALASVTGQDIQVKSNLAYPSSRIPTEMLKFQVRKSDAENQTPSTTSHSATNAQLQVSGNEKTLQKINLA